MSSDTDETARTRVTFLELFQRHSRVEIPIIQRDFAQGRPSEQEVRAEFLEALHAALSKASDDVTLPLDLDFVYGSSDGSSFFPLDGQQRLTTLFLLHWYLAWKEGRLGHFAPLMIVGRTARFSYSVRPSSREFFDSLLLWHPEATPSTVGSISRFVADQAWFFRAWGLDPTIRSALTMLDAIHERFRLDEGCYQKLMQTEPPHITFQLLDLESFGLSDDLYIKMNARGKPLTKFENFKARLENYLGIYFAEDKRVLHDRPVSLREYFSLRVDTAWSDLMWHYRDPKTHLFDEKFMHLLRTLAIVTRDPEDPKADSALRELRSTWIQFSFARFYERGCLDRPLVEMLVTIMDAWSGEPGAIRKHLHSPTYYDEEGQFTKALEESAGPTYEELVQFQAYCYHIFRHGGTPPRDPFNDWMRLVRNLAANTTYDRLDDLKRSMRSVKQLLGASDDVLEYFAGPDLAVQGFNEQQVREERIKAQLILRSHEWRELLLSAEEQPYFHGQIEFLLSFCGVLERWAATSTCDWKPEEDRVLIESFQSYYAKACLMFDDYGLSDVGNFRWERALLAIGDYLLPKGSNFSFLDRSDRDASWKRLLRGELTAGGPWDRRREIVKALLDRVDLDKALADCLDEVIASAGSLEPWRRAIVENPAAIRFCGSRMIRYLSSDKIYLLRKIRMSGEHAELFSYTLKNGLLSRKLEEGSLAPFETLTYHTVNTDSVEPFVRMVYPRKDSSICLDVTAEGKAFLLSLVASEELLKILRNGLEINHSLEPKGDSGLLWAIDRGLIGEAIDEVVALMRLLPSSSSA